MGGFVGVSTGSAYTHTCCGQTEGKWTKVGGGMAALSRQDEGYSVTGTCHIRNQHLEATRGQAAGG